MLRVVHLAGVSRLLILHQIWRDRRRAERLKQFLAFNGGLVQPVLLNSALMFSEGLPR